MKLAKGIVGRIRAQFGRPRGFGGRAAGWVMANRSSNRMRSVWAVSLLEVQPTDRVLEIGFGPGIAIRELSRAATAGHVCGIDHSEVMLHQASKRNADGIREGRVELLLGSAERLPNFEAPFDKVLTVNTVGFWDRPSERFAELRTLVRSGGRIAVAFQPRGAGASDEVAARSGREIAAALAEAGFAQLRVETLALKPAVVCALGVNVSR